MVAYTYTSGSCTTATWRGWVATASTCTTDCTWTGWCATTASAGIVWVQWNATEGTRTYDTLPYDQPRLTKEEQEALDAERIRFAAEVRARLEKERKEQAAADERATALLLKHLTKPQRRQYRKGKKFKVVAGDGAIFELQSEWTGNAVEFKDGKPIARFCIHPRERVPIPDLLLMQKLALESDTAAFRKTANRTQLAGV